VLKLHESQIVLNIVVVCLFFSLISSLAQTLS